MEPVALLVTDLAVGLFVEEIMSQSEAERDTHQRSKLAKAKKRDINSVARLTVPQEKHSFNIDVNGPDEPADDLDLDMASQNTLRPSNGSHDHRQQTSRLRVISPLASRKVASISLPDLDRRESASPLPPYHRGNGGRSPIPVTRMDSDSEAYRNQEMSDLQGWIWFAFSVILVFGVNLPLFALRCA